MNANLRLRWSYVSVTAANAPFGARLDHIERQEVRQVLAPRVEKLGKRLRPIIPAGRANHSSGARSVSRA
jgi:hypothetical protein